MQLAPLTIKHYGTTITCKVSLLKDFQKFLSFSVLKGVSSGLGDIPYLHLLRSFGRRGSDVKTHLVLVTASPKHIK